MQKKDLFGRSTYDPTLGANSSVYSAAAAQVQANFKQDQLDAKHSSGEINDQQYIQDLKSLTQDYRKGTGLRRELRSATVGAAQQVAGNYQEQVAQNQTQFADEALARYNQASSDYAMGIITPAQYQQEHELYTQSISGTRSSPTARKTTQQVLNGKFWDQYQSGRVRNIMREKQIKSLYREINGSKIDQSQLNTLSGGEGNYAYIKNLLSTDKGVPRDLAKEKTALQSLTQRLGRLPTREEINNEAYGATIS